MENNPSLLTSCASACASSSIDRRSSSRIAELAVKYVMRMWSVKLSAKMAANMTDRRKRVVLTALNILAERITDPGYGAHERGPDSFVDLCMQTADMVLDCAASRLE